MTFSKNGGSRIDDWLNVGSRRYRKMKKHGSKLDISTFFTLIVLQIGLQSRKGSLKVTKVVTVMVSSISRELLV